MPQAWPAITAAWTWLWNAAGFWANAARFAFTAVVSYGISQLVTRKNPNSAGLTQSNPLDLRLDSMAPHRVIYGQREVGPVLRFRHATGTNNEFAYLILIWAAHECEEIVAFKVDGKAVEFNMEDQATNSYGAWLRVTHHLGAHDQAADAKFVAELSGAGLWTTDDRWQGRCYSAVRLRADANKWPGGIPRFTAVIKGKKVYDYRDPAQSITNYSTWTWSDNPILCIADFIRGCPMLDGAGQLIRPYGIGADDDSCPAAQYIAEANACDESVALAAGGTEKRYTLNGAFDTDAEPPNVLNAMAGAMAGKIVPVGATFLPYAGVWRAPDFTVDETMLRGEPTATNPLPRTERLNVVKGTFINPATGYERDDFAPIVSDAFIAEDDGELSRDLDLSFTASSTMAQRIAKIALLRSRQGLVTEWPCNLRAVPALTGGNVAVDSGEFVWDGKIFEVLEFGLSIERGDDGGTGFATTLKMQENDPSIYDWSTDEEDTTDPAPNTGHYDRRAVPTPAAPTLSTSNFVQPDGSITPRIQVQWGAPADAFVTSGGRVQLEYKPHAASDWLVWDAALPGTATEDYITGVHAGVAYDVRLCFTNLYGVQGTYSPVAEITITNDTTVPANPTSLTATPGPGCVVLDWADNTEPDLDHYELWRSAYSGFASPVLIWTGYASQHADFTATIGMTYYYRLKASDTSDNLSGYSTQVSAAALQGMGGYKDYIFKRAASAPATPSGDDPAGWSDAPPAGSDALWMSVADKTNAGVLVGAWSAPVRIDGPAGTNGTNGTNGVDGVDGEDGKWVEFAWKRAATQPSTPTGNGIPSGWSDDPPSGSDPLWMSKVKQELDGTLVTGESWSTPIRHDGPAGANGTNGSAGDSITVEYSVNGTSSWHSTFAAGDLYMRQRVGSGSWSAAMRIVGEKGDTGPQGPQGPAGADGADGAPGGTYDVTIYWHPSGLGGGTINGTGYGGASTTVTVYAGAVLDIEADASVSGDSFITWSGPSQQFGSGLSNRVNTFQPAGDTSIYADY